MSDIIDDANTTAELFLEIAKRNRKVERAHKGVGLCLNCGAAVEGDARWCDVECREDWERAYANKKS